MSERTKKKEQYCILAINPADDEVDIDKLEEKIRDLKIDAIRWGSSERYQVFFNIYQLRIKIMIYDTDNFFIDDIIEKIESLEDYVSSAEDVCGPGTKI